MKACIYQISGMHCSSCEILIEKRLKEEKGIKEVEASSTRRQIRIEYSHKKPSIKKLNKIFKKENYVFSSLSSTRPGGILPLVAVSVVIILGFLLLNSSGLSAQISVNSQSALIAFLFLGLLAGFSSCSALVGGIILSMAKQWSGLYSKETSSWPRLQPHLLFNGGRLISYYLLGIILGIIGSAFQISLTASSIFTILISLVMVFLALQMLGIEALQKIQITLPRALTRFAADEKNFKARGMPFLMGALTFFLPCGFTITAQGLALASGSPWQSGLIMLFFALGTLPALVLIGFSSVKFSQKPQLADQFLKIAGILVLFFALYNINAQLNILGLRSFSDLTLGSKNTSSSDGSPLLTDSKQVLKMDAFASGYKPDYFKVKAGVPVRWEITDKGTGGCTNAIVSRGLFAGEIRLTPGTTSIKEFTPKEPGKYKFSCWMGMISGTIEVVGQR
ncbi:MAG: sulfite exporter TauE/SafE family protein [Candidatus Shapirobacteria bacterium]